MLGTNIDMWATGLRRCHSLATTLHPHLRGTPRGAWDVQRNREQPEGGRSRRQKLSVEAPLAVRSAKETPVHGDERHRKNETL